MLNKFGTQYTYVKQNLLISFILKVGQNSQAKLVGLNYTDLYLITFGKRCFPHCTIIVKTKICHLRQIMLNACGHSTQRALDKH